MRKIDILGEEYIKDGFVGSGDIEVSDNDKLIYEVIRIVDGKPLFFSEHVLRMEKSINIARKSFVSDIPDLQEKIKRDINQLLEISKRFIGNIQVLVRYTQTSVERYVYFIKHSYPSAQEYHKGIKGTCIFKERKNPNAKILDMDYKKEVKEIIGSRGVYEGILIDERGCITEGTRSNIFFTKDGDVYTTKKEGVLPGITREKIIEVIKENGMKFIEKDIHKSEIEDFDGVFMSGTSPEVLAFSSIDELEFDKGQMEFIRKIHHMYKKECERNLLEFTY